MKPRCLICREPAEVSWPVKNNPHCRRCVAANQTHVAESEMRVPKFGSVADDLHAAVMDAATWLRT